MKKVIVMSVLGLAASVATSYGQGIILFDTYISTPQVLTTYFNGPSAGSTIGTAFSAELYYALGTVTDPVDATAGSIASPVSGAFTALPASISQVFGDGSVQDGNNVQIAAYGSGAISFEILYTGTVGGVTYSGRSGAFTESKINVLGQPVTAFGDNGPFVQSISVAAVPEPTTLALAGLGGLASLIALRRKQA